MHGIKILSDIMHELCKLFLYLFLLLSLIFVTFCLFFIFLFYFCNFSESRIGGPSVMPLPLNVRVCAYACVCKFLHVCLCVCEYWSAAFSISIWLMLTRGALYRPKQVCLTCVFSAVSNCTYLHTHRHTRILICGSCLARTATAISLSRCCSL